METTMERQRARTRQPLAALGKATVAALVGLALCLTYLQVAIIGALIPPLAVFAVVSLVVAGIVGEDAQAETATDELEQLAAQRRSVGAFGELGAHIAT
jgi:hypothetical protein